MVPRRAGTKSKARSRYEGSGNGRVMRKGQAGLRCLFPPFSAVVRHGHWLNVDCNGVTGLWTLVQYSRRYVLTCLSCSTILYELSAHPQASPVMHGTVSTANRHD